MCLIHQIFDIVDGVERRQRLLSPPHGLLQHALWENARTDGSTPAFHAGH